MICVHFTPQDVQKNEAFNNTVHTPKEKKITCTNHAKDELKLFIKSTIYIYKVTK